MKPPRTPFMDNRRQAGDSLIILCGTDRVCYGLIYIRGCQGHFSPSTGGADLVRDIQPLSPWKTLVWCRAPGLFHLSRCISLVATTPISFETEQAVRLYGVNHGSI